IYGYKYSRGDVVVLFDADLDIPPQQIPILLAVMMKTEADLVITNKWHPLSRTIASGLRRFLSRSYNTLVRLITGLNIRDTQTGAKAIKRHVLDTIAPKMYVKRYAFDVELLLLAAKHGYRIAEAPSLKTIKLTSSFKPREIFYMLLELLSITYRHGRI
ncbi:MAG: glycosyltransferase, partial [Ignisphaera sp.]